MGIIEVLQSAFLKAHQWLYVRTDGRVGHRLAGVPTLLLRSVGRKSGRPRSSAVVYATDGDSQVVVASNGGADRPPGWLFNVRAQPDVEVQIGREHRPSRATVVEASDPDHPRLWALVNSINHDRFARYQGRTERPIAVVRLSRR